MRLCVVYLCIISLCLMATPVIGADLSVSPFGSQSLGVGEEIPLSIGITGATDGISGFHLTLDVTDETILTIGGVTFANWVMLEEYVPSGAEAGYIRGVDLSQMAEPGEGSFELAVLSLTGVADGMATITITPQILEDDFGNLYNAPPIVIPVTVGVVPSPPSGSSGGGGYSSAPAASRTPTPTPTPVPSVTPVPTATQTPEETAMPIADPVLPMDAVSDQMENQAVSVDEPDVRKSPSGLALPILASLLALMLIGFLRGRDPEN